MACYFSNYYGSYFDVCVEDTQTVGGITNGGGILGPKRSDVDKAKKWLEDEIPATFGVKETLPGVSGYMVAYSVSPGEATKFEARVEPPKAKTLPKRKLNLFGSLPAVTGSLSLSLSWTTVQMRDDEELLLLL